MNKASNLSDLGVMAVALWVIFWTLMAIMFLFGCIAPSEPVLPIGMSDNFLSDNWMHTPHPIWLGISIIIPIVTLVIFLRDDKKQMA